MRDNADIIDAIVVVLEIIAAVVGIVLLIVVIVATAPLWLTALAIGLAVAVVVGVALLAWADTGKRDWGDVGLAVVGPGADRRGRTGPPCWPARASAAWSPPSPRVSATPPSRPP